MEDIKDLRVEINEIDQKIIDLFEQRMDVSKKIGAYKKAHNLPVFDKNREDIVIQKNSSLIKNKDYLSAYLHLLDVILDESKKIQ